VPDGIAISRLDGTLCPDRSAVLAGPRLLWHGLGVRLPDEAHRAAPAERYAERREILKRAGR
jgi:hypothetical protein